MSPPETRPGPIENAAPTFTLRKLDRDDADAWASLREEALKAHPLAFGASVPDDPRALVASLLQRLESSEESAVFGAFTGRSLVGIVGVRRDAGKKERHKALIWGMYVTAGSRRCGAGEMLLRTGIEQARSWPGVEQVQLAVSEVAKDARRLYEKHGFHQWGREPRALCWEGRCADEFHLLLDLRARPRIVVVDYDPAWRVTFEDLRARVWSVVSDVALSIEHMGSTSVPGLAAKPIIDLTVVVPSAVDVPRTIERLSTLGYVHRGDLGITGREAFANPMDLPAHHLYVCPTGTLGLLNPLAVRDYLRVHPEAARAYGDLKRSLALSFPNDIDSYVDGKTDFILGILREAGFSADSLKLIERANRKPAPGGPS